MMPLGHKVCTGKAEVVDVKCSHQNLVDVALDFEAVEEAGAFFREINADPANSSNMVQQYYKSH